MRTRPVLATLFLTFTLTVLPLPARGDTLELADGRVIKNCYVRDEGVRITVWESLDDVGDPPRIIPKSEVKSWKMERAEPWDRKPPLPDLTLTFIEVQPKLASLHGRIQYDKFGRAWVGGDSPKLVELDEPERYTHQHKAVKDLKLNYEPGEPITLTAHVKNIGFRTAQPFRVEWRIDDTPLATDRYAQTLPEMEEATFTQKWKWEPGFHSVTVSIVTDEPEIASINNQATDALWAFAFTYVVSKGRVDAWHEFRSAYGTFSFEDFYRWHIDIMNLLFAHSVYPAAPEGIKARVRLDRIIYADYVKNHTPYFDGEAQSRFAEDGIRYDQGGWGWDDNEKEVETGEYIQTDHKWRNQTEWSLPHELGHQLGLVDWYALDYGGADHHVWPDNGQKVVHFMRHPVQMMHWHGPQPYGEVDAGYLNHTIDKPRGYFGDHYFAVPKECYLLVQDINGEPLPDAKIEIFQRGCKVDMDKPPGVDHGVTYYHVVEDGDFYGPPTSKRPVIVGTTNAAGVLRLPNRPAAEVRTLNGFHRTDNPFGNMNVVGPRNLMMVKVAVKDRVFYYWLEQHDFCVAWFRGDKDRYAQTLCVPVGSVDSPPAPPSVSVEKIDQHKLRVTWSEPVIRERHYQDNVIGYKVYRRIGNSGLDDRPWFAVATVGPGTREAVVDLRERPEDVYWFKPLSERIGVTSLGALSRESDLTVTVVE